MPPSRVAIIGIGLIGGSLARALKRAGERVTGYDTDPMALRRASELGVIDEPCAHLRGAVQGAEIVVIAVPLGAVPEVFQGLAGHLDEHAVITDVGSVKASVVHAARRYLGHHLSRFVPGHPIAGTEHSGVESSCARIFHGQRVILTPLAETDPRALERVRLLWRQTGAVVEDMEIDRHDQVFAATSHLPHVLAYALVRSAARVCGRSALLRYAAGGFADITRTASSNPVMWRDIFFANRGRLIEMIERFREDLAMLRDAIEAEDGPAVVAFLDEAKNTRDALAAERRIGPDRVGGKKAVTLGPHLLSVEPGGKLAGRLRVPGDKSISHRALMLGAIAEGVTEIRGFLEGEDTLATLQAFESMGVRVERLGAGGVRIHGVGLHGLRPAPGPIDLGNSGTSMRLMTGLLAGQSFDTKLTGDESLSKRPMMRVIEPLRRMGARIECSAAGTPPVTVFGGARLRGIDYDMPVASAQVKSGILLAALYARGRTCVREGHASRDHSERMLGRFGCPIQRQDGALCLRGEARLAGVDVNVPTDLSSAAFFIVGATIACGSDLVLEEVGVNPTRIGMIEILQRMGASIELVNPRQEGGEPVAELHVRASDLRGIRISGDLVPAAIDEFPVLFIAAACARGETLLEGAEELRYKESDRIISMAEGFKALGIEARPTPDGMRIRGAAIQGGRVESGSDHRVAMAFAIAGLRAEGRIVIADCASITTSFPNFLMLAREAGLRITAGGGP